MDCPRGGEGHTDHVNFCEWCGWDFTGGWRLCDTCNQTIKDESEGCECMSTVTSLFDDPEDL